MAVAVAFAIALGAGWTSAGLAEAHEDGEVAVTLEPDHVVRGGSVKAIGADFFPGDPLDVRFVVGSDSRSIGKVNAGEDGHFTASVTIPADVPVGPAALDFVSPSGIVQRVLLTIDPGDPIPPAPSPEGSDPEAAVEGGLSPLVFVAVLIAAAVLGLGFALLGRRQRR